MGQAVGQPGTILLDLSARVDARRRTARARSERLLQLSIATGDVFVIGTATLLAAAMRFDVPVVPTSGDVNSIAVSLGPWIVGVWMLANALRGTYARPHLGVGTVEYARVLGAAGLTASLVGIASYLTKFELSRAFFVLLFSIGAPLLVVWRWSARRVVKNLRRRGHLLTKVLISGAQERVDEVAAVLRREKWLGYQILGALVPPSRSLDATPGGVPVIGFTHETAQNALTSEADLVLFAEGAFPSPVDFRRIAWDLEGHDVQMAVVPSLSDISSGRMAMRPVGGLPLVHVEPPQSLAASRGLKRAFDLVGATLALLLASPVMIAFALLTKLQDRGPVLFRQTRVGRDGQLFECLKFRSMVVDAEARLSSISHLNKNAGGPLFKAQNDPRVTKVGALMRRFSIDELPQLVNVINGDMSLVGPRPALPAEVRRYETDVQRRLHVRPGLTGLWQVSGRSDLSWEDTVRLDLYYVDNWSIVQDLTILVRTVKAVFVSHGAY